MLGSAGKAGWAEGTLGRIDSGLRPDAQQWLGSTLFRQEFPALGLSLEKATENVEDDGRFYLIVHGVIIDSFLSERVALARYEKERKRLIKATGWAPSSPPPDPGALLRRMREEDDARAVKAESVRSKRSKALKKGGKGGSGGVQS